ncbi:hypothetical protein PIB30_002957 [Stylosanthes scabra]|uniref:Uncharacterized protein n=1 Tax=Stylosanthes scabra TaxID=79078 RepID=A0ABU6V1I4_9FABA|nr:hypothetical protein [Stylosanthes scabra]
MIGGKKGSWRLGMLKQHSRLTNKRGFCQQLKLLYLEWKADSASDTYTTTSKRSFSSCSKA